MPFLKDIIGETYEPLPKDEIRFVAKHTISLFKNIYSEVEYDKIFKASNVKYYRRGDKHGYDSPDDEKVYEDTNIVVESNPNFRLQDTLDAAARIHAKENLGKDGVSIGHVAHAIATTVHKTKVPLDYVVHALRTSPRSFVASSKYGKSPRKLHADLNREFQRVLKTKNGFNPSKNLYGKDKVGYLADCYVTKITNKLWENCAYSDMHWDAVEHVAKKHDVPKEMVAGSLLGAFLNMTDGDYASKIFRRDFHHYMEDKKLGVHGEQHSNRQSIDQIHGKLAEGKRTEKAVKEDRRSDDNSGATGSGLRGDDAVGEKITESAPPGDKYEKMIKAMKEKGVKKETAYAIAWKRYKEDA